jgi:hypothetical protein
MIDRDDIDAVLDDAAEQLDRVRELYGESLAEQKAPQALKVRIKHALDDQRSALEYLAHAIYERHGDGKRRKSYYPIAIKPGDFPNLFERYLPGVATNCPKTRKAIKDRQPYQPGYEWLHHLALLTNENKHRRLTPQTRMERRATRSDYASASVETDDAGNLRIEPSPGGTSLVIRGPLGTPARVVHTRYVDWLFQEPPLSALGTLQRIQDGLPQLIDDVIGSLP